MFLSVVKFAFLFQESYNISETHENFVPQKLWKVQYFEINKLL